MEKLDVALEDFFDNRTIFFHRQDMGGRNFHLASLNKTGLVVNCAVMDAFLTSQT